MDRAGDMTIQVLRAGSLGIAREPAVAHQQVFVAQTRGQLSAAHQRLVIVIPGLRSSLAARQRERGTRCYSTTSTQLTISSRLSVSASSG